jgi:hypothetical protein
MSADEYDELADALRKRYGHEFTVIAKGVESEPKYDLSSHPLVALAVQALRQAATEKKGTQP